MLKNLPPTAKAMLRTLFNNIQMSGSVPKKWKDGKVVMLLKKKPRVPDEKLQAHNSH